MPGQVPEPINHAAAKLLTSVGSTTAATALPAQAPNWPENIEAMLAVVGITSWETFGSFLAAMLTLCFLGEWWWKRFWKPMLRRIGWMKPAKLVMVEAHESDLTPLEGGRRR